MLIELLSISLMVTSLLLYVLLRYRERIRQLEGERGKEIAVQNWWSGVPLDMDHLLPVQVLHPGDLPVEGFGPRAYAIVYHKHTRCVQMAMLPLPHTGERYEYVIGADVPVVKLSLVSIAEKRRTIQWDIPVRRQSPYGTYEYFVYEFDAHYVILCHSSTEAMACFTHAMEDGLVFIEGLLSSLIDRATKASRFN